MRRTIWWLCAGVGLLWLGACGSEDVFPGEPSGGGQGGEAGAVTNAGGAGGAGGGEAGGEPVCPHEGPDFIDPELFEVCGGCAGGARCVPSSFIPDEFQSQLADCDAENKCVPDDFIRTNALFIADTCTSTAGAEGRCLSECLPQVADQADLLPQDVCPEFQLCVPCYDPISGEATGACSLSCDPGPTEPPVTLPECCDSLGTCVPLASVPPDLADALPQDNCPQDANDYVCAPTAAITDPNWKPTSCVTDTIIGGGNPGACLPDCLITGWESWLTSQSTCVDKHTCAPCNNPLTGDPTGACDF